MLLTWMMLIFSYFYFIEYIYIYMFPSYLHIQKAKSATETIKNEETKAKKTAGEGIAALYRGVKTRENPTIYLKKLERALTLLTDIKEKFTSNEDIWKALSSHLYHHPSIEPDQIPMPPPVRKSKRESVFVPSDHPARIERKEGDEGYLVKMLRKKLRLQFKANLEEILNDIAKISSLNLNVAAGVFRRRSDRLGVEKERGSMVPIQEKQIMLQAKDIDERKQRLILTLSGNPRILGVDGTVRLSVMDQLEKMKYMYTYKDALKEPARFIDFLIDFLNNVIGNFKHRFMSNPEKREVNFKKVTQGEEKKEGGRRKTRKKKKRKKRKTRKGKRRKRKTRKRRTRKRYR
jgi:hypothetical protein